MATAETKRRKRSETEEALEPTITLTFGDVAENHVGMQKMGRMSDRGFSLADVERAQTFFEGCQCPTEQYDLDRLVEGQGEPARLLIARNAVGALLGASEDVGELQEELSRLSWDTKARMYGRVVDKKARHNLCFAPERQEPDYEQGKGRVVAYADVPLTSRLRDALAERLAFPNCVVEGNLYYDPTVCFIGFHGDAERRRVVGVRLGTSLPLHFQWFQNGKPTGRRFSIALESGDLYIMSEKAVGTDWRRSSVLTLRHAAGTRRALHLTDDDLDEPQRKSLLHNPI